MEKSPFQIQAAEKYKQYQLEAKQVKDLIINVTAPILHKIPNFTDDRSIYLKLFGYMGQYLYLEVNNIKKVTFEKQMAEMYIRNIQENVRFFNSRTHCFPQNTFHTNESGGNKENEQP